MSTAKPVTLSPDILSRLVGPGVRVVLVYGSVARGEKNLGSDVDILQIVDEATKQFAIGNIHVAPYTLDRLEAMARRGGLFIAHLIEEAQPLYDPDDVFQRLRDNYQPVSLDVELQRVRVTSGLLDVASEVYAHYWPGLHKCAAFVLRSLAYVKARERNCFSFSLAHVMEVLGDTRLRNIATVRSLNHPHEHLFRSLIVTIEEYQGSPATNPFGSVEALTVNAWASYDMTAAWGLRILTRDTVRLTYG